MSAGLAMDVVGGMEGWDRCTHLFNSMNTDVQFAQCIKTHGYSMGSYREGFFNLETAIPDKIQEALSSDCQVMGVHLGLKHLGNYTTESFGAAISAVRDEDEAWTGRGDGIKNACPKAWDAISRWQNESESYVMSHS